jgi:hypothetical protein
LKSLVGLGNWNCWVVGDGGKLVGKERKGRGRLDG